MDNDKTDDAARQKKADEADDNDGDFTAEVLERELAALIDSALDTPSTSMAAAAPSYTQPSSRSKSPVSPPPATSSQNQAPTTQDPSPSGTANANASTAPDVDYLASLTAVLQAAQAMSAGDHPPESGIRGTLGADAPPSPSRLAQAQEAEDDLSEFIAQLTAQINTKNGRPSITAPAPNIPAHRYPTPPPTAGPSSSHAPGLPNVAELSDLSWDEIEGGDGDDDIDGESEADARRGPSQINPAARRAHWATSPAAQRRRTEKEKAHGKEQGKQGKKRKGPKQHICELCGKIFGRPSDLARHCAIHTGYRPFACAHPGCGKSFIQVRPSISRPLI